MVTTVGAKYLDKNHQFFFDNFFTSPALVKELLERKTYACGTCRVRRRGWPKDLVFGQKTKKADRMQPGETKMRQDGVMVATVWQDKRTVTVLSSGVQPEMGTAKRRCGAGKQCNFLFVKGRNSCCKLQHASILLLVLLYLFSTVIFFFMYV